MVVSLITRVAEHWKPWNLLLLQHWHRTPLLISFDICLPGFVCRPLTTVSSFDLSSIIERFDVSFLLIHDKLDPDLRVSIS